MHKFVFIESNTTGSGRICLQKALARGFDVLFLTSRPGFYDFLQEEMVAPVITDTTDPQQILDVLAGHRDVAGVFSTSEYFIETAAIVASRLGLPASDPDAIRTCRDKGMLYRVLRDAGIGVADTTEVDSSAALRALAPDLRYPLVVKPATGSGSVGVRLVHGKEELLTHGDAVLGAQHNERGLAQAPRLLLQSYVEGDEFSVEVIGLGAARGYEVLGVTGKHLGALPCFVETGHDFPAQIPQQVRDTIAAATLDALTAVGHGFGPAHVECRLREGEVVIIEINPRLAGGMIPQAIECATGIDVLDALVDLYSGGAPDWRAQRRHWAAIRFIVPERAGVVRQLALRDAAAYSPVQMRFTPLKRIGQSVELNGDYRDRIGLVIASDADPERLHAALAACAGSLEVVIEADDGAAGRGGTGRVRASLHPEALAIVRKSAGRDARLAEFEDFAAIDEAHLLMLIDTGICAPAPAALLFEELQRQRAQAFATIVDAVAPRGGYVLYEGLLIARLGPETGAMAHLARSRNDINACIAKLHGRSWFAAASRKLWRLRATLLDKAARTLDWPLPVYSQYQAAQPGSVGFYLWSIEAALRRDQGALASILDDLSVCPLGAGAGAGTDFPIRPELTARLLGFERSFDSALDAVASRDFALHLLSALAIAATTLSRLAHDLQLWSMRETAFLELPDALCGSSSLMPQKKNPYLLEIVKGKMARVAGVLNSALFASQRTPFSNSIEIGTEAMAQCGDAVEEFGEGCDLLRLMIADMNGDCVRMRSAAEQGLVVAAQVANELVREKGISFHAAHHQVGARIAAALDDRQDLNDALAGLGGRAPADVAEAAAQLRYGGGPGAASDGVTRAREALRVDGRRLQQLFAHWERAAGKRRARIDALIAAELAARGGRLQQT